MLQLSREVVGPKGGKRPPETWDVPMPDIDGCYVAHVLGDTVEMLPVRVGDAEICDVPVSARGLRLGVDGAGLEVGGF